MFETLYFSFNRRNICLAMSATRLKKLLLFSDELKTIILHCFYINFNRPKKTFLTFEFLLCFKVVFVLFYKLLF
jgi:hypothetical protein